MTSISRLLGGLCHRYYMWCQIPVVTITFNIFMSMPKNVVWEETSYKTHLSLVRFIEPIRIKTHQNPSVSLLSIQLRTIFLSVFIPLSLPSFPTNLTRPQASYSQHPLIVHSDVFPTWCRPTSGCKLHHNPLSLGSDTLLLPTVDSWSQKNSLQPAPTPPSSSPNPRKMASNQGNTHGTG